MKDEMANFIPDLTSAAIGKYKVQLFDSETNELIHEEEKNNMINPVFGTIAYHFNYLNMQFANQFNFNYVLSETTANNIMKGYCGCLSTVYTNENPETSLYGFPDGNVLCRTNLFKTESTENALTATVNLGESYNAIEFDENGKPQYKRHIVIDYNTNEGNGTFNSIVMSAAGTNMYKSQMYSNTSSDYSEYRQKSVGMVPKYQINKSVTSFGTSENEYNDSGCISMEAPGVFWICNSYGGHRPDGNPSASITSLNPNELTFHKFDATGGYLRYVESVKLSGAPEAVCNIVKNNSGYAFTGCYFKDKFYVATINYQGTPYQNTCYIYSREGVYESSFTWARTSSSSSSQSLGHGLQYSSTTFMCALGNCIVESRWYESSNNGNYLVIYKENGTIIKQYSRDEYQAMVAELYRVAHGMDSINTSTVNTRQVKLIPTTTNGKMMGILCYDQRAIAYLDLEDFEFKPFDRSDRWAFSTFPSYQYEGLYVHEKNAYYFGQYYVEHMASIPWWSWCKLAAPVTKTSATTMKIQYDIVMDMLPPFSPAIKTTSSAN